MVLRPKRNGKSEFYRSGKDSPIHDEYFVTVDDVVRGIMADPDLDQVEKIKAIKYLSGLKAQELTNFLNTSYKKLYGSNAKTITPAAEFIKQILERRNKEKRR